MTNKKALATALFSVSVFLLALFSTFSLNAGDTSAARPGYYRFPTISGDSIIFTAEGELWSVSSKGGPARRLTSNPGKETHGAISPDGKTVATGAGDGKVRLWPAPAGESDAR